MTYLFIDIGAKRNL